jgi:hypothetical protein
LHFLSPAAQPGARKREPSRRKETEVKLARRLMLVALFVFPLVPAAQAGKCGAQADVLRFFRKSGVIWNVRVHLHAPRYARHVYVKYTASYETALGTRREREGTLSILPVAGSDSYLEMLTLPSRSDQLKAIEIRDVDCYD